MTSNNSKNKSGDEREDVSALKVALIGFASMVLLVVVVIVANQFFILSSESLFYETVLKPEEKALRELRSREDRLLNSYQMIDPEKGIYRVPISQAMRLMTEEAYQQISK